MPGDVDRTGNVDGTESPSWMLDAQVGAGEQQYASCVWDRWAATGRFEGAAAEKAVPFPGAVRRSSLRCAQPILRGSVAHEVGGIGVIRLKRGA